MTHPADVKRPGSQEDMVSSGEPAHNLVEDAVSGAEVVETPYLQALAVKSLPLCLWTGRGWFAASYLSFPGGSDGTASAYSAGDLGLIPGTGRSSGEGNGNPLRYSCLENPMDRGA